MLIRLLALQSGGALRVAFLADEQLLLRRIVQARSADLHLDILPLVFLILKCLFPVNRRAGLDFKLALRIWHDLLLGVHLSEHLRVRLQDAGQVFSARARLKVLLLRCVITVLRYRRDAIRHIVLKVGIRLGPLLRIEIHLSFVLFRRSKSKLHSNSIITVSD